MLVRIAIRAWWLGEEREGSWRDEGRGRMGAANCRNLVCLEKGSGCFQYFS